MILTDFNGTPYELLTKSYGLASSFFLESSSWISISFDIFFGSKKI